jgi:hypothetical protein
MNNHYDYEPDEWVIIKIKADDNHNWYRVFGSWFGGYVDGDSWRLNSGIVKYTVNDRHIHFYGTSGSVYTCDLEFEGIKSRYNRSVLDGFLKHGNVEIISLEDFIREFKHD